MNGAAFGIKTSQSPCPDCDAHQQLIETHPSVYVLQIHHDDTCPQWTGAAR